MEDAPSSDACRQCAECCQHYPFVELSQRDIEVLEAFTGLHFRAFTNPKGEAAEGHFLKFNKNGGCFFLNESNHQYSCGVYEARPGVCGTYPSTPTQHEFCVANRTPHPEQAKRRRAGDRQVIIPNGCRTQNRETGR